MCRTACPKRRPSRWPAPRCGGGDDSRFPGAGTFFTSKKRHAVGNQATQVRRCESRAKAAISGAIDGTREVLKRTRRRSVKEPEYRHYTDELRANCRSIRPAWGRIRYANRVMPIGKKKIRPSIGYAGFVRVGTTAPLTNRALRSLAPWRTLIGCSSPNG